MIYFYAYLIGFVISFLAEIFIGWVGDNNDMGDVLGSCAFWPIAAIFAVGYLFDNLRDKRIKKDKKKQQIRISIEKEREKYQAQAEAEVEEMVRMEYQNERKT